MLLDENSMAATAKPGTSARPTTTAAGSSLRPMTNAGRPITGFVRPSTMAKPTTSSSTGTARMGTAAMRKALQSGRATGGGRPVTSSGRFVRLGTASMLAESGGPFINAEKLDLKAYAARPVARALCDYIIYHDRNYKKALELSSYATEVGKHDDW